MLIAYMSLKYRCETFHSAVHPATMSVGARTIAALDAPTACNGLGGFGELFAEPMSSSSLSLPALRLGGGELARSDSISGAICGKARRAMPGQIDCMRRSAALGSAAEINTPSMPRRTGTIGGGVSELMPDAASNGSMMKVAPSDATWRGRESNLLSSIREAARALCTLRVRGRSGMYRLEEDAPWVTQQCELRHVVREREEAVRPEERVAREGGEHRERALRRDPPRGSPRCARMAGPSAEIFRRGACLRGAAEPRGARQLHVRRVSLRGDLRHEDLRGAEADEALDRRVDRARDERAARGRVPAK